MVRTILAHTSIPALHPGSLAAPLVLRYPTGRATLQLTGLHLRLRASAAATRAVEAAGGLALVVTARVHLRGVEEGNGGPEQDFVLAVGSLGVDPATESDTKSTAPQEALSTHPTPFAKRALNALARRARAVDVVGFTAPESFLRLDLRVQMERVQLVLTVEPHPHPRRCNNNNSSNSKKGGEGRSDKPDAASWASILSEFGMEAVVVGTVASLV